jgi:hypothetical protein
MRQVATWVFLLAGLAPAGELREPLIGYFGDEAGGLRPVVGVSGSFLVQEAVLGDVRSFAFAGGFGLIQTGEELLLVDRAFGLVQRARLAAGESLLAVSPDGRFGAAYLQATEELCRLAPAGGSGLECVRFPAGGSVLSLGIGAGRRVSLLIERGGQLWLAEVDPETGEALREAVLAGVTAPALLLARGGILYARDGEIVVRDASGAETRLAAPAPVEGFQTMGDDWVRLRSAAGAVWVLRLGGAPELHRLPEKAR